MPRPLSLLHVVTLNHVSGLEADAVKNEFVTTHGVGGVITTALTPWIMALYNDPVPATPLARYIADSIDRGADRSMIETYDITGHLDGSDHGSPIAMETWTLGASEPGQDQLPSQAAAVFTFYGEGRATAPVELPGPPIQHPKARRTGKIFAGPLNELAVGNVGGERRFNGDFRARMAARCEYVRNGIETVGDSEWHVWSRMNENTYRIVGGHVDDRIDTHRSRAVKKSAQSTWGLPG
jgi:hypothetical protein